jgi:hypothetical protein
MVTLNATDNEVIALPTNYQEYYSTTDWAAQRIDEKRLMALYATDVDSDQHSGQTLYEEAVCTWSVVPQGYLTIRKEENRVLLLHHPMVFAASAAQDTRPWEDQVLMFVGVVMGTQLPPFVALPKQLLVVQRWQSGRNVYSTVPLVKLSL